MTDMAMSKQQTMCIKGVAILLVILGHMSLIDCAGAWGVHLFLFVSGYGIFCAYEAKGLQNFWNNRINTVWIPYVFCAVAFLAIRLLLKENFTGLNVLVSLIGLDLGLNIDPTMWYISYIFACYGIFWIMMKIPNRQYGIALAFILQVIITGLGFLCIAWSHGTIAWAYVISFPLGILLGKIRSIQLSHKLKNNLLIVIGILCAAFVVARYGKPHAAFEELAFTLLAAIGLFAFLNLIRLERLPIIGGGTYVLGKLSFFMYLNEYFLLTHFGFLKKYLDVYLADVIILVLSICTAKIMQMSWNSINRKKK